MVTQTPVAETAEKIQSTLTKFFEGSREYRAQHLASDSATLFDLVTPAALKLRIESDPETREFGARFKAAAHKALSTPIIRPDGVVISNWVTGYIAFAIDSKGNVLAFNSLPEERAEFLNYQVPKALRARILSEQTEEGQRDPTREDNLKLLERLGIDRKYQYPGAIDDVQLPVGSGMRWVYVVGGATIPDQYYIENVYGPSPKGYSYLEGTRPLEGELDDLFGRLVLYYLKNPDAKITPIPEPESITKARGLLR